MKKILMTIMMALLCFGIVCGQKSLSSDSPFIGRWVKFNHNGPQYSLDFLFYDYSEDPDVIGSFLKEDCMDCYPWKLRKSKIVSESENSISFDTNDNNESVVTLTYDPLKKNVIVSLDGSSMATFNEDTNKLKYWYARQNSEVMRNQDGTSVMGHVEAGDRFELKKWTNPFLENHIQVQLPDNTYGWIKSSQVEEGIAEPIKSKAFPLSWIYEDEFGEQTIKIKKTGGDKVLVDYVYIKYSKAGERSPKNEEIQYSGKIKGNQIILTKSRPLYFKGSYTKLLEPKELRLIPDLYTKGMWRTRLSFEGHEFIPVFVKKSYETQFK